MTASVPELTIGFSPCPNDTFIFHAMVHGLVPLSGFRLASPVLADVETLNEWALEGRLDITKLSFHALAHALDRYRLIGAGSALGRGCGPLLVAAHPFDLARLDEKSVAIPGRFTTAAMLLRLFAPQCRNTVAMRFDEIMPSVAAGRVDAGVIIHESRFTYPQHGLVMLQDLGAWWEEATGLPIPLGGIAVKRSLGDETIAAVEQAVRQSVQSAFARPERSRPYIRQHAQELDDTVISNHIGLYVNHFSEDLGEEGVAAVREFLRRGRESGVIPPTAGADPLGGA